MTAKGAWGWFFSWRALCLMWGPIFLITAAHYGTSAAHHWIHDVLRRLYYIPIVLGAFHFGLRGALGASVLVSLVYIPHAFTQLGHMDPAGTTEKILEILLYNVVAVITGVLAGREKAEKQRQMDIANELQLALEEKKGLEEQLVRSGRLRALGELTAGLAHEIRNPLASIKGTAEIIADEVAPDSPRRKMVDIQKLELERLQALLDRFLRFARLGWVELSPVCICQVADHVRQLVAAKASDAEVTLVLQRERTTVSVMGDREQLAQVLLNLVLNALDVTRPGGTIRLVCGTTERRGRRYGFVVVEDEGPGVPADQRQKIFDPFYTTKDGGSGLGLSIAARIIDQHDGYLEVETAEGGGARFEIMVPAGE